MARKLSVLFSVVAAVFLFSCAARVADKTPAQLVTEAKSQIKEVSIQDVKKMIDAKEKVIILDVRDSEEYEVEHLPGAINMSRGKLDFHIHELIPDKAAKVVVYWIFDKRGPLATKAMNDLGYRNAVNMIGGLKAWKEAGYPVEK